MDFLLIKQRIASLLDKTTINGVYDDFLDLAGSHVNNIRKELAMAHPLRCFYTEHIIRSTDSRSYAIGTQTFNGTSEYQYGHRGDVRFVVDLPVVETEPIPIENISNLSWLPVLKFYQEYPNSTLYSLDASNPCYYTIQDDNFIVNNEPSDYATCGFLVSFYRIPDDLVEDEDETFFETKYHEYLINEACYQISLGFLKQGSEANKWMEYYKAQSNKYKNIIMKRESVYMSHGGL